MLHCCDCYLELMCVTNNLYCQWHHLCHSYSGCMLVVAFVCQELAESLQQLVKVGLDSSSFAKLLQTLNTS